MTLSEVITKILNPGLAMLPINMDSVKARVMLLAIGLQESRFEHRWQVLSHPGRKGPARGFWQFEKGGGVKGVMRHEKTTAHAHRACAELNVPWDETAIWLALETNDLLACVFARLLLFSDPRVLPDVDDADGAWELYAQRTWRPGKPHPESWQGFHDQARRALGVA